MAHISSHVYTDHVWCMHSFFRKEEMNNVLVIGMITILPGQYKEVKKLSTYPPPLRDFYRLQALQALLGDDTTVYTMNLESVSGIQEDKKRHTFGSVSCSRGAKALKKQFPYVVFNSIYFDYVRFPSEYMIQAYSKAFMKKGFMDTLVELKMINASTDIFIPQLKNYDSFCLPCRKWNVTNVTAAENPLSEATNIIEKENKDCMGGYCNSTELSYLTARTPFCKINRF